MRSSPGGAPLQRRVFMVRIHERCSASHTINTDFSSARPASTFAPTFARGRACRDTGVKRHEDRRFLLDDGLGVGPAVCCIRATERRRITWGGQVLQCTGHVLPDPVAAAGGHAGRRRRRLEPVRYRAEASDRNAREETRRQEDRPAPRRQGGAAAGLNEQYAVTVRASAWMKIRLSFRLVVGASSMGRIFLL